MLTAEYLLLSFAGSSDLIKSQIAGLSLRSNLFRLTQKEFPVFIEDVRLIMDNRDFVSDGTPQRRVSVRAARQDPLASNQLVGGYDPLLTYRLSSSSKEEILHLVPEE
jgi:hypothetical protein